MAADNNHPNRSRRQGIDQRLPPKLSDHNPKTEVTIIYRTRVLRGPVGSDERWWETMPGYLMSTFNAPIEFSHKGPDAKGHLTDDDLRTIGYFFWQAEDWKKKNVTHGGPLDQRDMEAREIVAIFCGGYSAAALSFDDREEPFTFHPIRGPRQDP